MKPLGCNIDANCCGDLMCQHLIEPCEWWLKRMSRDEYKKRQKEHYEMAGHSACPISPYWWDADYERLWESSQRTLSKVLRENTVHAECLEIAMEALKRIRPYDWKFIARNTLDEIEKRLDEIT